MKKVIELLEGQLLLCKMFQKMITVEEAKTEISVVKNLLRKIKNNEELSLKEKTYVTRLKKASQCRFLAGQLEANESFIEMERLGRQTNREMRKEIPRIKQVLKKLESNKPLSLTERNLIRKLKKRWVDLK